MANVRILASILSVAVALAACDARNELDKKAPAISLASMRAEGKAAVVAELFFDKGECYTGEIAVGPADGTRITHAIETRGGTSDPDAGYAGALLPAGTYHILQLDCPGSFSITSYSRKPGIFDGGIIAPLGSFTVSPGDVAYIGSLHAVVGKRKLFQSTGAAIAIEDRSEQVRQTLRQSSPALADAMAVRLAAPVTNIPVSDLLPPK